ncbi:universal stress protein [Actinomadura gamaensis]|uniref:Universal stress protein n=1 Tax=Actinomadura gamaensis TaxID=1763541 RepID=A0ABV9U3K4_9ACTN
MRVIPEQRCVVVGVDGSPNSMAALHRAAREAAERHARLDVIHVLDTETDAVTGAGAGAGTGAAAGTGAGTGADRGPRPLRTAREWLRLRDLVAGAVPRAQHLTTRLRILHGTPEAVLPDAAEHAELLVVGARAHSEHGNPFGGDTVPAVRERARCPVVICADHGAVAERV